MGNRDANHSAVAGWYEELWCLVRDTHALGGGFPDMVVRISTAMGQIPALVEVKTADGRLKPFAGDIPAAVGNRLRRGRSDPRGCFRARRAGAPSISGDPHDQPEVASAS